MSVITLAEPVSFIWDKGNEEKNWIKHRVTKEEAEKAFSDDNKLLFEDVKHSTGAEKRFILFGKTDKRKLILVFTIRNEKVRVISARPMNRKEVILYEKAISAA